MNLKIFVCKGDGQFSSQSFQSSIYITMTSIKHGCNIVKCYKPLSTYKMHMFYVAPWGALLGQIDCFVVLGLNKVNGHVNKHQIRVLLPNLKPFFNVVVSYVYILKHVWDANLRSTSQSRSKSGGRYHNLFKVLASVFCKIGTL